MDHTDHTDQTHQMDQRVAAVRTLARISRSLERASDELSLAQYRVLAAVAVGEARASRVASRLALGKPAISAAVETLVQRGLIAKDPVSGDQRASALRLSVAGEAVLTRVEQQMVARLDSLLARSGASAATSATLVSSLVELGRGLDEASRSGASVS
jgi:DNA-binding MarR family transcriptional regulator